MMGEWLSRLGLLTAGIIHLLPLVGVTGAESLQRLYGLAPLDIDMEILLRHRAVLFGLLGALLVISVWRRSLRPGAIIVGLISAGTFLLIAGTPSDLSAPLARVWWADVAALAGLLVAAFFEFNPSRRSPTD